MKDIYNATQDPLTRVFLESLDSETLTSIESSVRFRLSCYGGICSKEDVIRIVLHIIIIDDEDRWICHDSYDGPHKAISDQLAYYVKHSLQLLNLDAVAEHILTKITQDDAVKLEGRKDYRFLPYVLKPVQRPV